MSAACGSTGSSVVDDASADGGSVEASEDGGFEPTPEASYESDSGCQPGVPRCQGDFGYQMCRDDHTWGGPVSCEGYSTNGTSSYCVMIDGWGYCVEPACWYWITHGLASGTAQVGVCAADGTFSRCTAGGTLEPGVCDAGCAQVGELDGLGLGYCNPACVEGARECLGGPLYRECTGGKWSDLPSACPSPQECNPVAAAAAPQIRCGGACDPGTSRCSADSSAVEACTAAGQWTVDHACALGRCLQGGQQAQCQAECTPGQSQCAYDGAATERACGDGGVWSSEATCPAGTQCRMSGPVALGCVACVGSTSTGGNAFNAIDATCQGAEITLCGPDGNWLPPSSCGDAGTCVELQRGASSIASCAF